METKRPRLPRFKTTSEEAEFWDTHSTEPYVQGKPIKNPLRGPFLHEIGVTLTSEEMDIVDEIARERGVKTAMKMAGILLKDLLAERAMKASQARSKVHGMSKRKVSGRVDGPR